MLLAHAIRTVPAALSTPHRAERSPPSGEGDRPPSPRRAISAIARHLARDPKTVRAYLSGARTPAVRRRSAPDSFGVYKEYVTERLREDPHVWASALYDEVRALGYERSYQRFTHELRSDKLRPHCEPCAGTCPLTSPRSQRNDQIQAR